MWGIIITKNDFLKERGFKFFYPRMIWVNRKKHIVISSQFVKENCQKDIDDAISNYSDKEWAFISVGDLSDTVKEKILQGLLSNEKRR